ncbi:MAG: helix-turn-helix domain-containing protein [Rhodobacteraceae bacterium]|nr:helix-turn-helix domain-containing protein [Paracoccaceae bacterium]
MAKDFAGNPMHAAIWLYYVQECTQDEIASLLGTSRQTVAKYLKEGRKRGLVTTRVDPDLLQEQELAARLRAAFNLKGAHVVPAMENADAIRHAVGRAGARVVTRCIDDGAILGISSGRTVGALVRNMPPVTHPDSTVIEVAGSPMLGVFDTPAGCAAELAGCLTARCRALHAPAYLSTPELARALSSEPLISEHFSLMAKCHLLVFGIGELTAAIDLLRPADLNQTICDHYLAAGARGIVFGRFIDARGDEVPGPLIDRTMAIALDRVRLIPNRIGIGGGTIKSDAVRAAATGGILTHLVVDTSLATALLDR